MWRRSSPITPCITSRLAMASRSAGPVGAKVSVRMASQCGDCSTATTHVLHQDGKSCGVVPEWKRPSEALKRMAEAPEPAIKPMTVAERDAVVEAGSRAAHVAAGHTNAYANGAPCHK